MSNPAAIFKNRVDISNNSNLIIHSGGNLGIGVTNPSTHFDVDGSGNFSGNLIVGGELNTNNITYSGGHMNIKTATDDKEIIFTTNDTPTVRIRRGYLTGEDKQSITFSDIDTTGQTTYTDGSSNTYNTYNLYGNCLRLGSNSGGINLFCHANGNTLNNTGDKIPEGFNFFNDETTNKRLLMYIAGQNGNVGIRGNLVLGKGGKHTSGSYKLDVNGSGNFDGNLVVGGTITGDLSGNAATATKLQTAKTIGGVSFNGSASIDLSGVNQTGNQDITKNNLKLTSTSGSITFDTNSSERMRILSSGNVGIGTNNPSTNLDVSGDGNFSGDLTIDGSLNIHDGLKVYHNGTQNQILSSGRNLYLKTENGNTSQIQIQNAAVKVYSDKLVYGNDGTLTLTVVPGQLDISGDVTIADNKDLTVTGDIGIGTSPSRPLHIKKDGTHANETPQVRIEPSHVNSNDAGIDLIGKRSNNTTVPTSYINFKNYDNDIISTNYFGTICGRAIDTSNNYGGLSLMTSTDGSLNNLTDRLFIDNSGDVGIGTTNPSEKLEVSGNLHLDNGLSGDGKAGARLIFDNGYGKRGPNKISFHSTNTYGFGVESDTVSYHTSQDHKFYSGLSYNGIDNASGTPNMTISSGNKVGIGKTPSTNLDVNGDVSFSGDLDVGGNINSGTWNGSNIAQNKITNLQSDLNGKQANITGAATTITSSDLTANRALISNGSGKVAVSSTITTTELGYLDGLTSNIKTQLDGKVNNTGNETINGLKTFGSDITLSSSSEINFGSTKRQMINLHSNNYGIGVENIATYFRSGNSFRWYTGGTHSGTNANGTELMELDSNGNLTVSGSTITATNFSGTATTANNIKNQSTSNNSNYFLLFSGSGNSKPVYRNSTITVNPSSGKITATEFHGDGSNLTNLPFSSLWSGSSDICYNSGNVGIGTNNPSTKLEVNGTVKATNYIATSDRNLKENIVQINNENIINKVTSLNGYNFNFKDDETKQTKSGLIAQEVEELIPELVSTNTDGNKSMDYNGMIPYLVECIKVQQKQIQTQQNQINMLKAKIENM